MGRDPASRRGFDAEYLTDGKRLFEVDGVRGGFLLLRDSAKPNEPVMSYTAKELAKAGLLAVRRK